MILRIWRSASSIPAAVQRRHMSADCQCLTLRLALRQITLIDSIGVRAREPAPELPVDPEALQRHGLLESLAQRGGGAGMRAFELAGEDAEAVERGGMVGQLPGRPQAPLDRGTVAFG